MSVEKRLRNYYIPAYIKERFWRNHVPHLNKKEVDEIVDTS